MTEAKRDSSHLPNSSSKRYSIAQGDGAGSRSQATGREERSKHLRTDAAHESAALHSHPLGDYEFIEQLMSLSPPYETGDIFKELCRQLAEVLQIRMAVITEVVGSSTKRVRSVGIWGGRHQELVEYELAGTPCQCVMQTGEFCCPAGVQQAFPTDLMLNEIGAEGYFGIRLTGQGQRVLGTLCALHDQPLENTPRTHAVLRVFATRAAIELERKQASVELRHRQAMFGVLVKHAPAAVAMFDNQMRYLAWSHRWITDYGLEARDLTGLTIYEVFPEIGEAWQTMHQRVLAGIPHGHDCEAFVRLDGKVDWVRWEFKPWYTSSGKIGGVIAFTEVITERKRAKSLLKAHVKVLESLAAHQPLQKVLGVVVKAIEELLGDAIVGLCIELTPC